MDDVSEKKKPGRKRRGWNKEAKLSRLIELRTKGVSFQAIGKELGMSKPNVIYYWKKIVTLLNPDILKEFERKKVSLYKTAEMLLLSEVMNPDKLQKASLNNAAYALAQVHTARRLEEGLSTSNLCYAEILMQKDELDRKINILQDQYHFESTPDTQIISQGVQE